MSRQTFIALLMSALLIVPAQAQDDDWYAVTRLSPETIVTIQLLAAKHEKPARLCRILKAGPDGIECGIISGDRQWIEEIPRDRVQQIRLEDMVTTHGLGRIFIEAAIGGALFAAIGLSQSEGHPVDAGLVSLLAGSAVGAGIGAQTRTEGYKLKHGPVVYRLVYRRNLGA